MNSSSDRDATRERFMEAVRCIRRGDYGKAKALVESIRRVNGDRQANIARSELWNFAQSDKDAK